MDVSPEAELHGEAQLTKHAPRTVDGHRIELCERVTTDRQAGIRRWKVWLRIDGTSLDFERRSHYLPHAELVRLLEDAGLEDVGRAEVTGERYAVFVGQRPLGHIAACRGRP